MLLEELVRKEPDITMWSVCNHKEEPIAMTTRNVLLQLCEEKREFKKSVEKVLEKKERADYIKVKLKKGRDPERQGEKRWLICGRMTEEERKELHRLKFAVYPPITMDKLIHDSVMRVIGNEGFWDWEKYRQAAEAERKSKVFLVKFEEEEMQNVIRFCVKRNISRATLAHYSITLLLEGVFHL